MKNQWIFYKHEFYTFNSFCTLSIDEHDPHFASQQFIKEWVEGKNAFIQNTSGSTGSPKSITISRSQMLASAKATLDTLKIVRGNTLLLSLSCNFIGGKMMLVRALVGELNIVLGEISSNPLERLVDSPKIDFFSFVPYQMDTVLKANNDKYIAILNQGKVCILGGAKVNLALEQRIKTQLTLKVFSTYGMTETVSHVALKPLHVLEQAPFEALEGVSFSVDEDSCLIIQAEQISGVAALNTQDVVQLLNVHSFEWLGRKDFVINSGGIKIFPEFLEEIIEKELRKQGFEVRAIIFGLAHEELGEAAHLLLETAANEISMENLKGLTLPAYHYPKSLHFTSQFEETANGKINRKLTLQKLDLKI